MAVCFGHARCRFILALCRSPQEALMRYVSGSIASIPTTGAVSVGPGQGRAESLRS